MSAGYRIQRKTEGHFVITVPVDIVESIPEDTRFVPVVTSEGILFKAYRVREAEEPKWMKK